MIDEQKVISEFLIECADLAYDYSKKLKRDLSSSEEQMIFILTLRKHLGLEPNLPFGSLKGKLQ